jgi:hypothetical protein
VILFPASHLQEVIWMADSLRDATDEEWRYMMERLMEMPSIGPTTAILRWDMENQDLPYI